MATDEQTIKGQFEARVSYNRQIRACYRQLGLELAGPGGDAFAQAQPGQFAEFDVSTAALPPAEQIPEQLRDTSRREVLLRRPFSFARVARNGSTTELDVLYCVLGPGTLRMTTLRSGDKLSLIGPLGRGFWVPQGKTKALLVAGGMGAPPLQHLAQVLTADYPQMEPIGFAGAKTVDDLPFEVTRDKVSQGLGFWLAEFSQYAVESLVATDDGSAGVKGMVTDCLADWLKESHPPAAETIIYACGPEPMLAKVAQIAREKRIDCQVSMERLMACGIGLCQSCAVECRVDGSGETVYKLCCKDGPVFDAKEVVF